MENSFTSHIKFRYNNIIHTLTRCSLDKPPSCSQRFITFPVVELSCQFSPCSSGGVLDVVLYSPLPEVSRNRGFLSYLFPYEVRHLQNVFSQCVIIVNCGSDHGDVLMGEAVVWGIRRQRICIMYTLCTHHYNSELIQPGQGVTANTHTAHSCGAPIHMLTYKLKTITRSRCTLLCYMQAEQQNGLVTGSTVRYYSPHALVAWLHTLYTCHV